MKSRQSAASFLGLILIVAMPATSRGQRPALATGGLTSREAIEAEFQRDLVRIERIRLERLATLAATQPKAEALKTYEALFRFAIAVGLYSDAEPTAERVLRSGEATPEVALLAEMVNIVGEANRGAYEDSLKSLAAAIAINEADPNGKVRQVLPLPARLSLINVYSQRLIQAGEYEIARQALTMLRDTTKETAVKNLALARLRLVELIGKPAPRIAGTDLDGKPLDLDTYKGQLVFLVFWASWSLPNAQEAAAISQVAATYREQGFRVVGVNLDTLQDGGVPVETVMPNLRRFLIEHNVRWPNLINGTGTQDYAKAYGVTEIPSNVLIGRDGKVIQIDLNRVRLSEVVGKVLGQ